MKPRASIFRSGTSGMVFPYPNKQAFPPAFRETSRLTYYASLVNSLEVNSSFYKVPMASTVKKWTEEVPEGFEFTFKLWRDITHAKGFAYKEADIMRFMQVIGQAGDKKGCLLIQFPPSLTVEKAEEVEIMLEQVSAENTSPYWKLALEFRHPSWYTTRTYAMADAHHASIVLHDMPRSATQVLRTKASFVYLRFHGPEGDYRGGYSDEILSQYALQIKNWMSDGKDVYVYFNNTIGDALQNVFTLNRMVNESID